jgi:hypothetical protein
MKTKRNRSKTNKNGQKMKGTNVGEIGISVKQEILFGLKL